MTRAATFGMMALICALAAPGLAPAQSAPAWTPPPPAKGFSYPDCYCTNRGERVEMGATSCLRIGAQSFTARCAMSLNNPMWRKEKDGCDPGPSVRLWQGNGGQPG